MSYGLISASTAAAKRAHQIVTVVEEQSFR